MKLFANGQKKISLHVSRDNPIIIIFNREIIQSSNLTEFNIYFSNTTSIAFNCKES